MPANPQGQRDLVLSPEQGLFAEGIHPEGRTLPEAGLLGLAQTPRRDEAFGIDVLPSCSRCCALRNDWSTLRRAGPPTRCFRRRMWLWRPPASGVRGGVIQLSRPPSRPS